MYILALETTGPHCSVALLDREGNLHHKTGAQVMNHLQTLTPMIRDLMDDRDVNWEEVSHIAVSVGPGSFTGIRIGVSAGRALNQITGIPLIGVGTLDAFGRQEREDGKRIVCPVLDARRSQIYGGAYLGEETVIPAGPYMLDEFLDMLAGEDDLSFVGDGLSAYGDRIRVWGEEKGKNVLCREVFQQATGVALTAWHMLESPGTYRAAIDLNYDTLKPEYMRIPEAERKLRERKRAEKEAERKAAERKAEEKTGD